MQLLANDLAGLLNSGNTDGFSLTTAPSRPVLDQTGLNGKFDVTMTWGRPQPAGDATIPAPSSPDLLTAIQEQLGLKLEPTTGPVDVLVIDHIEEPSPNWTGAAHAKAKGVSRHPRIQFMPICCPRSAQAM